jgi:hypothetical protein
MRIDDFICLGRSVPEASQKYGVKVCMAGYSEELRSFLRVYPLEIGNPIRARDRCVLEVERNRLDSRDESWKLIDRSVPREAVGGDVKEAEIVRWLLGRLSPSIRDLNERRASLGVLEIPGTCRGSFRRRADVPCPDQGSLFDFADEDHRCGAGALDIAPYLAFFDSEGRGHDLQLREWGAYEWIRNRRDRAADLWENLRLDDGRLIYLIVGNMNNRRNVWIVIKMFRGEPARVLLPGFDAVRTL